MPLEKANLSVWFFKITVLLPVLRRTVGAKNHKDFHLF